jgi:hypothetical protein
LSGRCGERERKKREEREERREKREERREREMMQSLFFHVVAPGRPRREQ